MMTTRRTAPARAGRTRWIWIALVALAVAPVAASAASWQPALSGSLGGTYAVLGVPDGGGSSATVSLLWPVMRQVSFGVMFHADDAGATVDSLRDTGGRGTVAGKVEQRHRTAWGGSWRLDYVEPKMLIPGVEGYVSGTWGYYRVADDVRGAKLTSVGSTGFSVAGGVRVRLGRHFALGSFTRYHRLFNDREGRFVSSGLEGFWR